jgi:hypothetical protein
MTRLRTRNSNLYLAIARKSRFKVQKMAQLLGNFNATPSGFLV